MQTNDVSDYSALPFFLHDRHPFFSGGVLAALYNAKMTGQGRHVKCSLLESQVSAMANVASGYLIGGVECARMGTQHPNIVPYGVGRPLPHGALLLLLAGFPHR